MKYSGEIGWWNGACYEPFDSFEFEAASPDEAIARVNRFDFGEENDYDILVTLSDEGGVGLHQKRFQFSLAKKAQEEMEWVWEVEDEYTTSFLGAKDGEWYVWAHNGGYRGAHDAKDGSGSWLEVYQMPVKVTLTVALAWFTDVARLDTDAALSAMEGADKERTKAAIIREVGVPIWREDELTGVYRVNDYLYVVDCSDADLVCDEEAEEFVRERDPQAADALNF